MNQWQESTYLSWEDQKGTCPICGQHLFLTNKAKAGRMIGHHIESRKYGNNTASNCEARHEEPCERWAHQACSDGNPTREQIMEFRFLLQANAEQLAIRKGKPGWDALSASLLTSSSSR